MDSAVQDSTPLQHPAPKHLELRALVSEPLCHVVHDVRHRKHHEPHIKHQNDLQRNIINQLFHTAIPKTSFPVVSSQSLFFAPLKHHRIDTSNPRDLPLWPCRADCWRPSPPARYVVSLPRPPASQNFLKEHWKMGIYIWTCSHSKKTSDEDVEWRNGENVLKSIVVAFWSYNLIINPTKIWHFASEHVAENEKTKARLWSSSETWPKRWFNNSHRSKMSHSQPSQSIFKRSMAPKPSDAKISSDGNLESREIYGKWCWIRDFGIWDFNDKHPNIPKYHPTWSRRSTKPTTSLVLGGN